LEIGSSISPTGNWWEEHFKEHFIWKNLANLLFGDVIIPEFSTSPPISPSPRVERGTKGGEFSLEYYGSGSTQPGSGGGPPLNR